MTRYREDSAHAAKHPAARRAGSKSGVATAGKAAKYIKADLGIKSRCASMPATSEEGDSLMQLHKGMVEANIITASAVADRLRADPPAYFGLLTPRVTYTRAKQVDCLASCSSL